MHLTEFYLAGNYENPLTALGRARTIAALFLAQGNVEELGNGEMRRDVLNALMSPRAVGYWLNDMGWLEKTRKVGRVQLLRLTRAGLQTCNSSIHGGSHVPTTSTLVQQWRRDLLNGKPGFQRKEFPQINVE